MPTHDERSGLVLPEVPSGLRGAPVAAWSEPVQIPTYQPEPPDRYPMFLDKRVYQGSSGRVYPLPFHDRISQEPSPRTWEAFHLENRWIRLMVLPELGGRIHVGYDRSAGYDFFYRNNVVKPALVGLAGPWISGGVEFNWPQHHRPATFMPVDVEVEEHDDGARTIWCSDHDPFHRMKGMHGITLHPDRAVVELRVRLHNRSDDARTFLWWANVAASVHDRYQSFFPTDVSVVADHARRATTGFPRATSPYYGIDYPRRVTPEHPEADRLDWYRHIPVPTSYMCVGSTGDFFGGYDHAARAGFVHWADHRVAPGKKQWTWGNDRFGHAWDRNLTDADGPYVELMAGVYTDNQPDFAFLAPGETKTFSQYWYPIQRIGVVHQATTEVALHVAPSEADADPDSDTLVPRLDLGVAVTRVRPGLRVAVQTRAGLTRWQGSGDHAPGDPLTATVELTPPLRWDDVTVVVSDAGGELLRFTPGQVVPQPPVSVAVEPPLPADVASAEELYLVGLHLAQYRHATRRPEPYWHEALRRDPGDTRCATALAARAYERADYATAVDLLQRAVSRLTRWNANPYDGEPHYRLGLALARLGRHDEAYDAWAKAAWTQAWRAPAHRAMARARCVAGDWPEALRLLDEALVLDGDNLAARDLRVVVLRRLGRADEAEEQLARTLAMDPLDWWARDLRGDELTCDARTVLDVAQEYASAGCTDDALRLCDRARTRAADEAWSGVVPVVHYRRARILAAAGRGLEAERERSLAAAADPRYCFPSGPDDEAALRAALEADPGDGRAAALLGNWLYDADRRDEAVQLWRRAVTAFPDDAVTWRNLAVAAFNVEGDAQEALACFDHAVDAAPDDARLIFERDQLAKRIGVAPAARLADLEARPGLVRRRDDLTVEYVALLAHAGRLDEARAVLLGRSFQPWEGGEGQVLSAWERVHLGLARTALREDRPADAEAFVRAALDPSPSLGEAPHPLANRADLFLALGDALGAQARRGEAEAAWRTAAAFSGDFLQMDARPYSEKTLAVATACRRLGLDAEAAALLDGLEEYARAMEARRARIDYFATSLPDLLLFDDDLDARQRTTALLLRAQADAGRSRPTEALCLLAEVLCADPHNPVAHDLRDALTAWTRTSSDEGGQSARCCVV